MTEHAVFSFCFTVIYCESVSKLICAVLFYTM